MFRRLLTVLILFSMTLHCAGRLGVLSWVYENRHAVAYTLGVIAEVPIAMCNSQYDFHKGIQLEIKTPDKSLPIHAFQAQEINLFFISSLELPVLSPLAALSDFGPFKATDYSAPLSSVFRPPLFG